MKITLDEWTYIGKYNPAAKWIRHICLYSLEKKENGDFRREAKLPWWFYILSFVPLHILKMLWCIWDGGLKEFEIEPRLVDYDNFHVGSSPWYRAREIWEKNKTERI